MRDWVLIGPSRAQPRCTQLRATDGTDETQTDRVSPPAPDGATGYHTIRISVT
jgi:hypothetical protein